mgnify:CR=1 FL=1
MKDVIVKYFSSKSLSTIDMNFFFKVIFDKFGDSNVFFEKMNNDERIRHLSQKEFGISIIKDSFIIIDDKTKKRIKELESEIIQGGQK